MKRALILTLICLLQAACSTTSSMPSEPPTTPGLQVTQAPLPRPADTFEVKVWIDDPTPPRNSTVVVRGSLIKNGYYLGGIMMQATWPDEAHERGVPNCDTLVTYGAGKCIIDTSHFPPDQYVPVTVIFVYGGNKYTAITGFTPTGP